jgi:hypothetical protein
MPAKVRKVKKANVKDLNLICSENSSSYLSFEKTNINSERFTIAIKV